MCMLCKCDTVKQSTTTHVVNAALDCLLLLRMYLVKNVNNVVKSFILIRWLNA